MEEMKQMIEKYVPMVRKAIEEISPYYKNKKEFQEVLKNAKHPRRPATALARLTRQDVFSWPMEAKNDHTATSAGCHDSISQ